MRRALGPALLVATLAAPLAGQALRSGRVRGWVRSADGSPLANVQLTLVEARTNRSRTFPSGPDGSFSLRGVAPGP